MRDARAPSDLLGRGRGLRRLPNDIAFCALRASNGGGPSVYYKWLTTIGLVPNTTGNDDAFAVMRTVERRKPGGRIFEYSSMKPLLLSRILEKMEDRPFADVFRDRILSKIGAEHDATFVLSPQRYALAFGFTTVTLRDFARFGSIFTPSAKRVTGASILSADTVKRIQAAGNPAAYAGG